MFFRLLLIFAALYLLVRYLSALFRPRPTNEAVHGAPRKRKRRIDENRIQDADFKDLPKE